jgi:hypothetical protein
MKRRLKSSLILLAFIIILVLILDFFSRSQSRVLEGKNLDTALGYITPAVENIALGLSMGDYQIYSRDFSASLRNELTESIFLQTHQSLLDQYGGYRGCQFKQVQFESGYMVGFYDLVFQKGIVGLRLVVRPNKPHDIQGIALKTN